MLIDLVDRFRFFMVRIRRIFLMFMSAGLFHAFHMLLFHRLHTVCQAQGQPVIVRHGTQDILHPHIVFPACIDEDVTILDGDDILGRRFIGMALLAGLQKHLQIRPVPGDLPHEIIGRKDGGDHTESAVLPGAVLRLLICAAALSRASAAENRQAQNRQNGQHDCCPLPHRMFIFCVHIS